MAMDLVLKRWIPLPARASALDWEALYSEQLPRIHNFFRYRVGPGPDAEDLTSLTFEKAWQARERYDRNRGRFSAWILAVARNVAVDYFRSSRQRQMVPIEDAGDLRGGPAPDEIHAKRSDAERLASLLARLPDEDRELMSLKYGAGLKNRDIARVTGLSLSNVGTRVHRIVARLRTEWDKET